MIKFLVRAIVLLVVVVVVAVGAAYFYINQLAKAGIERGGEYALGVKTSVGSVGIDLAGGEIGVGDLEIANPPGFEDPNFFHLGELTFHMPLANIQEDVVRVKLLALDGVDVNIERGKSGSNYGAILDNLKKFESGSDKAAAEESSGGKQFIVDELRITAVKANVRQELVPGQKAALAVEVPEILLNGVGTESGGVTMGELTGIITKAVLNAIARSGGLPSALLGDLKGSLKGLGSVNIQLPGGPGAASALGQQYGGEAGKKVGEEIDKTLKGLGGLLGGKDKKKE